MRKLDTHKIGIDQGDAIVFSDFENNGPMWSGTGARKAVRAVTFSETYAAPPSVTLSMSMVDMSNDAYMRCDLRAENVTKTGFDITFRTWADTRIARMRVAWTAFGPLPTDDTWDI